MSHLAQKVQPICNNNRLPAPALDAKSDLSTGEALTSARTIILHHLAAYRNRPGRLEPTMVSAFDVR